MATVATSSSSTGGLSASALPAAAVAAAHCSAGVDDASYSFDAECWPVELSKERGTLIEVAELRRAFHRSLRSRDGRPSAATHRLLFGLSDMWQSHSWRDGWQLSALLSWAEHSGRTHLLPFLVSALPVGARDSLLRQLLHFAPRLSLLQELLARCPLLRPQMTKAHDRLHDLCCAIRPPADTFCWLLDQQCAAPSFHCGRSTPLTDLLYTQSRLAHPAPNLLDMVRSLLQWEPSLVRCYDDRENLPLHLACIFEHSPAPLDVIQLLLDTHPEGVLQPNKQQASPIHLALELAQQPSIELLQLLSGGDLDARSASVPDGGTLLHLYCRRNTIDIGVLTFLCDALPAAAVTQSDANGMSPLRVLIDHSASLDGAQLLLQRGTSQDEQRMMAYLEVASTISPPLFSHLLELDPSRLERIPRSANLLVHMMDMVAPYPAEIVRRMLQLDPGLRLQTDWAKLMPIHKAAAKLQDWDGPSKLELLRVLLERDTDTQLCARSRHGDTPLDVLAKNGKCPSGAVQLLLSLASPSISLAELASPDIAHRLLLASATPALDDFRAIAARQGSSDCFTHIDPKTKWTALHCLCARDDPALDPELRRLLVGAHHAAVTAIDSNGCTPLMLMCRNNSDAAAAKMLLDAAPGSAAQASAEGRTALHYACMFKRPSLQLLQLLLSLAPQSAVQPDKVLHSLPLHLLLRSDSASSAFVADSHPSSLLQIAQQLLKNERHAQLLAMEHTGDGAVGCTPAALYFQRPGPRDIRLLQLLLLPGLELPTTVFELMCNNLRDLGGPKGRPPGRSAQLALQEPITSCELLTTAELRLLRQSEVRILPAHITALCASPQLDGDLLQALLPDAHSPASIPLSAFRSLLSNPRLDAAMLRLVIDAYPPDVAGNDQWTALNGEDATTARQHASALALLLANAHAADLPEFAQMVLSLVDRAPEEVRALHSGDKSAPNQSALCTALQRAVPPRSNKQPPILVSLELVQALHARCPDILQLPSQAGRLPIHLVCAHRTAFDIELVRWIVEATEASSLCARDSDGLTPAHVLIGSASPSAELLELLLCANPAVAADQLKDAFLLHRICSSVVHNASLLRLCTESYPAAVLAPDLKGRTPLQLLCCGDTLATVEELTWAASTCPSAFQLRDAEGRTALMDACGHPALTAPVLEEMLKQCSAETALALVRSHHSGNWKVSGRPEHARSALHELCCSSACSVDLLSILLTRHQALASMGDPAFLPLYDLLTNGHATAEQLRLLLRFHPEGIRAVTDEGLSILGVAWAVRRSNPRAAQLMAEIVAVEPQQLWQGELWEEMCADESLNSNEWDALDILTTVITSLLQPERKAVSALSPPPLPVHLAAHCWKQLLGCSRASTAALYLHLLSVCPALKEHVDAQNGGSLLHLSARVGCLPACRALIQAGAPLLLEDSAGLTALAHCSQPAHPSTHAYLSTQQRLHSMFRGRFEIDTERGVRLSGRGKVKFAFDCGEGALKRLQAEADAVAQAPGVGAAAHASSIAEPVAAAAPFAASNTAAPATAATTSASGSKRLPAVIKLFNDRSEFIRERDLHSRLDGVAPGRFFPRLLAVYEPLAGAAEDSDDTLPALCMEAGTESVRQQMERRAAAGRSGRYWSAMDALGVAAGCVAALRFLHSTAALVHADIKAENVVAFADGYKLIDLGSACAVDAPLSLEHTPHYAPPEQAKRVLAARRVSEAAPPSAPVLFADPSYDMWSLGVLLFTLRAGRPLFDSQLGDRDADAEAILESVAAATDDSILALLQQQQRSRMVQLQDNEVSLLRHLLAVDPEQRYRVSDTSAALERMLQGLSATQTGTLERMVDAVTGAKEEVRAARSDVKAGHKQLAKIDQGLQGVGQQVKQVKVAVKAVAAGHGTEATTVLVPAVIASLASPAACIRAECVAVLQDAAEAAELRARNQQLQAESAQQKGEIEHLRRGQAQLEAEVERLNARLAAFSADARTAKVAPEPTTARTEPGAAAQQSGCGCVIC